MINVDLEECVNMTQTDEYLTISRSGKYCEQQLEKHLHCKNVRAHLSWSLSLNVAFVDLFGPGRHPEGGLDLLVVLTHQPKLNVFITEF